jgi:hypothetical protein
MDSIVTLVRRLPDLLERAAAENSEKRYDVQDRLRSEQKGAYVYTTVYRTPPRACSTGEHQVPAWDREIGRGRMKITISEAELHEIEHHNAKLDDRRRATVNKILEDPMNLAAP